ncbi:MAG: nickel/cobalt transporter [Stappiaceae bacterium]
MSGFFGWISAQQTGFYRALTETVKSLKSDGSAAWLLIGLSFAYGVFHAAGPGHGKAVISTYVLANGETLRKGIVLSFASAMAQAITAIVLIGIAAIILNMTSIAITQTTRVFEIGSYALITALGVWLTWLKVVRPILSRRKPDTHHIHHEHNDHHDHHHHHGEGEICGSCGHAHAPDPAMLQGTMTFGRAWSVILAIGLRPCSGALIVLVFALSQGLIWAGVLSTIAMGIGTGLTVALLATLAVGARGAALRFVGSGSAEFVHRAIEVVGALLVLVLGVILLIASIGWGA